MASATQIPTRYRAEMTFRSVEGGKYGITAAAPFEVRASTAEMAHQMARNIVSARSDFRSFLHTSVEVIGS